MDNNKIPAEDRLFISLLRDAIEEKGFKAEFSNKYDLSIVVAEKIEISSKIMGMKEYPNVLLYHILVVASNETMLPEGIEDNLAGFGSTPEEAMLQGVNNFMVTMFPALLSILNDVHSGGDDIIMPINGTEVVVHTECGPIRVQGKIPAELEMYNDSLFAMLHDKIEPKLLPQKINWMKIFISSNNGEFTGECIINGEYWDEGLDVLRNYVGSWPSVEGFLSFKQFLMFRVCDKYDDVLSMK